MSQLSYNELKKIYERSPEDFFAQFSGRRKLIKAVVEILAHAKYDNGWPLGMLTTLQPQFGEALGHWTAGGYDDIREQQESKSVRRGTYARSMERYFYLLPEWRGDAVHVSKEKDWSHWVGEGTLELKSFMGCCAPGFRFAYVHNPVATLKFTCLRTARYVGALSKESCEGEVLLPKGAIFQITSVNKHNGVICLEEKGVAAL